MKPQLIQGGIFKDERGEINFVNGFDMSVIKRMYFTTNTNKKTIRAWQGHKIETRWFFCVKGSFKVKLVAIDNWENPSKNCTIFEYQLLEENPQVLYIPKDYANGFQALKDNSKLMILSDYLLNENPHDNYRINLNYFNW